MDSTPQMPVAIVGIGCLFPQAGNPTAYWANIREGLDATPQAFMDLFTGGNTGLGPCTTCHTNFNQAGSGTSSCNGCHQNPLTYAGMTGFGNHPSWLTECTFCHGDGSRAGDVAFPTAFEGVGSTNVALDKAAPPTGTQGEIARTDVAVGAHLAHLLDNALAKTVACGECHELPSSFSHARTNASCVSSSASARSASLRVIDAARTRPLVLTSEAARPWAERAVKRLKRLEGLEARHWVAATAATEHITAIFAEGQMNVNRLPTMLRPPGGPRIAGSRYLWLKRRPARQHRARSMPASRK